MSERYCKDCRYCHHANIGLLCMGQKGMPHTSPYGSCDSWKSAKQTHADRIRAMTDEELALEFAQCGCPKDYFIKDNEFVDCPAEREPSRANCVKCWLDWLKQEAEEGE